MPKKDPEPKPIGSWRVFRTFGGNKFFLGIVEARDKFAAIQTAIEAFNIPTSDRDKLSAEERE